MSTSTLQTIELPESIPQRFPRSRRLRSLCTQHRRPPSRTAAFRKRTQETRAARGPGPPSAKGRGRSEADAGPKQVPTAKRGRSRSRPRSEAGAGAGNPRRDHGLRKRHPAAAARLTLRRAGRALRRLPGRTAFRGPRARPRAPRWAAPPIPRRRSRRPDRRTPRPASGRRAPAPAGR